MERRDAAVQSKSRDEAGRNPPQKLVLIDGCTSAERFDATGFAVLVFLGSLFFLAVVVVLFGPHGPVFPNNPSLERAYGGICLVSFLGVPLGLAVRARRRKLNKYRLQNVGKGYCLRCGYDLRATPNCCPECGTIPPR